MQSIDSAIYEEPNLQIVLYPATEKLIEMLNKRLQHHYARGKSKARLSEFPESLEYAVNVDWWHNAVKAARRGRLPADLEAREASSKAPGWQWNTPYAPRLPHLAIAAYIGARRITQDQNQPTEIVPSQDGTFLIRQSGTLVTRVSAVHYPDPSKLNAGHWAIEGRTIGEVVPQYGA